MEFPRKIHSTEPSFLASDSRRHSLISRLLLVLPVLGEGSSDLTSSERKIASDENAMIVKNRTVRPIIAPKEHLILKVASLIEDSFLKRF